MKLGFKYLVYFLLNIVIPGKKIYHYLIKVFINRNLQLLAEILNKLAQNLNIGNFLMSCLLWWLLLCFCGVFIALTFVYDQLHVIEMNNLPKVALPCNCTSCRIFAIIFLLLFTFWPTRSRPKWWSLITCLQAWCSSVCPPICPVYKTTQQRFIGPDESLNSPDLCFFQINQCILSVRENLMFWPLIAIRKEVLQEIFWMLKCPQNTMSVWIFANQPPGVNVSPITRIKIFALNIPLVMTWIQTAIHV